MPLLYVVATPIGNLEDITLRALRVLREVDLIAAEDTRVTRKLLTRHQISTAVTSYHEHNRLSKLPRLVKTLEEQDVALVSDAGMPGISDPGAELVSAAAEAGFQVVSIPGASALTSAIAVSGLPADQFVYLGFLPRKPTDRRRILGSLTMERRALVAFETPQRLKEALADIYETLGDRPIAVCREMTKLHEEVFRGVVSEAMSHFVQPRGELTLVIEGLVEEPQAPPEREDRARRLLKGLRGNGHRAKEAVSAVVAETGLRRSRVYRLWLEGKEATSDQD